MVLVLYWYWLMGIWFIDLCIVMFICFCYREDLVLVIIFKLCDFMVMFFWVFNRYGVNYWYIIICLVVRLKYYIEYIVFLIFYGVYFIN